jgi:hypothetical protein
MDEDLKDQLPGGVGEALRKLDRDAARRAASVDAGRVAERVLARLREEPATPLHATRWNLVVLRVAAVLAVVVLGGAVAKRVIFAPRQVASLPVIVTPFDSVTDRDSVALGAAVDEARAAADGAVPSTTVLVEDLNEQELETLLHTMDSSEGSL